MWQEGIRLGIVRRGSYVLGMEVFGDHTGAVYIICSTFSACRHLHHSHKGVMGGGLGHIRSDNTRLHFWEL